MLSKVLCFNSGGRGWGGGGGVTIIYQEVLLLSYS